MNTYEKPELTFLTLTADEALTAVIQSEPTVEDNEELSV